MCDERLELVDFQLTLQEQMKDSFAFSGYLLCVNLLLEQVVPINLILHDFLTLFQRFVEVVLADDGLDSGVIQCASRDVLFVKLWLLFWL